MVSINKFLIISILPFLTNSSPIVSKNQISDFIRYGEVNVDPNHSDDATYGEIYKLLTGSLTKRTDVQVCLGESDSSGSCISDDRNINQLVSNIGGLITTRQGECGDSVTFAVEASSLYYKYQSTGSDCRNTALPETDIGALKRWIKNQNGGKVCKNQCVQLKHGTGQWTGFVGFGTDENAVKNLQCDESINSHVSKCESGGNADI